jgi:hypothetical protein
MSTNHINVVVGSCPEIHCHSLIHATVDPPALFGFIPDNVLSGTASAVIKASLSALQVSCSMTCVTCVCICQSSSTLPSSRLLENDILAVIYFHQIFLLCCG